VQNLGDIADNLKGIMKSLQRWSKEKFGAVTKELEQLMEKLENLCANSQGTADEEIKRIRQRMDEVLYREEMMWLQRSHISWLQEGDRNTKYFHRKAAARSNKNRIKRLKKDDGQVTQDRRRWNKWLQSFSKTYTRQTGLPVLRKW
jgi:DNA replication protein DnaC